MTTQTTSAPTAAEIAAISTKNVSSVTVLMTPPMKDALSAAAAERKQSVMEMCRTILADAIDFTLPTETSKGVRTKYASEAEKKAAQQSAAKRRREETAQAVELYRKALAENKTPEQVLAEQAAANQG